MQSRQVMADFTGASCRVDPTGWSAPASPAPDGPVTGGHAGPPESPTLPAVWPSAALAPSQCFLTWHQAAVISRVRCLAPSSVQETDPREKWHPA